MGRFRHLIGSLIALAAVASPVAAEASTMYFYREVGRGPKDLGSPPVWQTPQDLGTFADTSPVTTQVIATDADGNLLPYQVVGGSLPPGVGLNPNGTITGNLSAGASSSSYTFSVMASDAKGNREVREFTMHFANTGNHPPYFATAANLGTFPSGLDLSLMYRGITVIDDDHDRCIPEIIDGSLPPGITIPDINNTTFEGVLPKVSSATTYSFTMYVCDAMENEVERTFTMTVNPVRPAPSGLAPDAGSGPDGVRPAWTAAADLGTFSRADFWVNPSVGGNSPVGNTTQFVLVAGSLPEGLSHPFMDENNGPRSGYFGGRIDPSARAGDYFFTFRIMDDKGYWSERTFKMTVE